MLPCGFSLPVLALGTMGLEKKTSATSVVAAAFRHGILASLDLAPTYRNESDVGVALRALPAPPLLIEKVPRKGPLVGGPMRSAANVRTEVSGSLAKLGVSRVDLLLLQGRMR